ncbi:LAMC3 [Acrasis kona]|uniref:Ribosome biogenesis protein NOP53 n=1 Tax=Acrasis kona TaxID=1008807 RepID=A0AAW2YH07_9EUKA
MAGNNKNKRKILRRRTADALRDNLSTVREQDVVIEKQTLLEDDELFVVDKPRLVALKQVDQKLAQERRAEKIKKFKHGLELELEKAKSRSVARPVVRKPREAPKKTHAEIDEDRLIRDTAIRYRAEEKSAKEAKVVEEGPANTPKLLSFWNEPTKQKKIKRGTVVLPKPHSGQSYNPEKSKHQETILLAYEGEKKLLDKYDKLQNNFKFRMEQEAGRGGDDVLDGIVVQQRDVEEQDPSTIAKTVPTVPKKKPTKTKLINLKIQRANTRRKEERIKSQNEPSPKLLMTKINSRLRQREDEKEERRQRKKQKLSREVEDLKKPVNDVKDVLLEDELPSRLGSLDGNTFYLWRERLASYHNSKLMSVPSMRKGNIRVNNLVVG